MVVIAMEVENELACDTSFLTMSLKMTLTEFTRSATSSSQGPVQLIFDEYLCNNLHFTAAMKYESIDKVW